MSAESYQLISADGRTLFMDVGDVVLQSAGALGNPEINYIQQVAYYQDGAQVSAYNALPRALTLTLAVGRDNVKADEITKAWQTRKRLFDFLSAAAAPLIFRIVRNDASVRELHHVYPSPGALFEAGQPTSRVIAEPVTLTAFDPIWRDGVLFDSGALTGTTEDELVYPKTYPIFYGAAGTNITTGNLNYKGQWRVYPKITVTGPYNTLTITNSATSAVIQFFIGIPAGQTRVIDLSSPTQGFHVTDSAGNNAWDELTVASDLTGFYIDPFVDTTISANATSGNATLTTMRVQYAAKYIGV